MRGLASPSGQPQRRSRWRWWLLLTGIALPLAAGAQAVWRDFYFQTLGTESGLAQNTIITFLQDRNGFIWLGTAGGLQKYDGYAFTTYEHSGDDPASAPESPPSALVEDAGGDLWLGTGSAGVYRHTPGSGVFRRLAVEGDEPRGAAIVHALLFDARRGIWVGSAGGVALLDAGDGHRLRWLPTATDDGRAAPVHELSLTADGSLWAASAAGLLRLAPQAHAFERVDPARLGRVDDLLLARDGQLYAATPSGVYRVGETGAERVWPATGSHAVSAITEDERSRFWLALPNEGLAVFDRIGGDTRRLAPDDALEGGLPEAVITNLNVDRSGLLWIGTAERGICKVDPDGVSFSYLADRNRARAQTAANYVRAIFEDAAGGLWLGTQGDGLKRYDPVGKRFDYYDGALDAAATGARQPPRVVNALVDAGNGRVWVAMTQGAALLDPARGEASFLPEDTAGVHGLPDREIRSLARARDGKLWLGTGSAGLVEYDPTAVRWRNYRSKASATALGGLSDDRVIALHEDRNGRIWAGGADGLNLIDPASGRVRVFRNDPDDPRSLAGNLVRAIQESADGVLWVGTQAGLSRLDALDERHASFTRWLPKNGLPNATIYAIADDGIGRLWLSTNRGITSFERASETFRTFSAADGLQGLEFNNGAYARLRGGRLAFGGTKGVNLFLPQAVTGSRYAAPVVLTEVRVGNRSVRVPTDGDHLHMAAADRVAHFEFAALDFTAPERNRFTYQLEGFDEHWIEAGTRHEATYANLDPGRYRFKVRASNHDGYWSEQAALLDLDVTPPWWENLAARTAYLLVTLTAVLLLWRTYRRRQNEQDRHHQDLREREDRLRTALWGSGDDFWDWNIVAGEIVVTGSGGLYDHSAFGSTRFGWERFRDNLHPDDRPALEQRVEEHFRGQTDTFESEYRVRRRGQWIWVLARGKIVERDEDGQPTRMSGTARNITATRTAERERRIAEEVIRSMAEAVAVSDTEFRFLTVNPAFTRITGWRRDEVTGQSNALLNSSQHSTEHYLTLRETLIRSGRWRGELWQRRKDGDEFLSWTEITEVRDASGQRTHFVNVISDITDRKRVEQELRYLANYDALTGLPNRTLLSERIGHAIVRARRGGRKVGVLFLDLDRFKHVNDSMGHAAGDRMLKAAGSRLRQIVREGDSVARLGGDEFTVVIEDIIGGDEAERVAEKIIAAFEQPLELDSGQEVIISPSIGVSLYPDHGQLPSDLLKFADTAMYQAKERGRKTWMVYTEAMDAAARLRATMAAALGKALERDEFSLVYQPKLSLLDERVTGVEALLRWHSGDLGDVSPGLFIPLAEETGLIIAIGDWVVAQACAQLARWRAAGIGDITMSVNVSVAQLLRGDLIQRLCDVLAEHDIAPNQLELELTESMVMANAEQSITTLRRLKAIGLTLSIDDFGTGYSSLSYLKRLPIDTLKIDKEFVGDITTDPDDEAITATVIAMAHSLGLNVVAEGVELAEQVEYLREQDCDEIQGHWLAPPLAPAPCLAFLHERAQRRRIALGEA